MVDKLESLVIRLETAVAKLEQAQGGERGQVKSETPSTPSVSQSSTPCIEHFTAFHPLYQTWEEKAKATGNQEIVDLTQSALHVFNWTDAIVSLASISKKPSNDTFGKINAYIRERAKEIDEKFVRPRKIENHAKTVKEGVGATLWFLTDAPHQYLEGVIEPTVYNGNKVKVQKVQAESDWVDAFYALLRGIKNYTKEQFITGLIWKGKTDADFTSLLEGKLLSSISQPSETQQSEEQKPNKLAFLADINKGETIAQGLKVADRKPKGQPSTEPPLKPHTHTETQKKPEVKEVQIKPPKKYKTDHWFIENFDDDRTLVIDEADLRESVYIDKCNKCLVQVKGKVKSIFVSNCKKLDLIFDTVVSSVEVVNSKGLNLQAQNHAPSIVLDNSEAVKIYLAKNLETDIVSSKVTELNVSYIQEDGDFAKDHPITEQFITKWDANTKKFVTKPLELFM